MLAPMCERECVLLTGGDTTCESAERGEVGGRRQDEKGGKGKQRKRSLTLINLTVV